MGLIKKYELGRVEVAFIAIVLVGAILAGAYAWKTGRDKEADINSFADCVAAGKPIMESYPEQCAANGRTWSNPDQQVSPPADSTMTTSGQGGFSIVFPDNWGQITRVMDSDWFIIPGDKQPDMPTTIVDEQSYGGDGQSVFSALIHDNFADPEGAPADYTLVNGKDNPIQGKKYVKEFTADEQEGIGYQRFKGDRNYTYVFDIGEGKQLRVYYSVYGSDPRNLNAAVDAIVDSIVLK